MPYADAIGSDPFEPQAHLSPWPFWAPAHLSPGPLEPQPTWAPAHLSPWPIWALAHLSPEGKRGCAVSFQFGEISSTGRKNRHFWARPYLRAGYYYSFSWGFWICNQFCCTSNGWARVGRELGESWARVFVTYQYVYQMKAQIILNSNLWLARVGRELGESFVLNTLSNSMWYTLYSLHSSTIHDWHVLRYECG